ncbi:glycosyltransferase [Sphingomonas koreensis]|nr:glycosyltransferase [Sphingomonas koreensis]
MPGLKAVVRPFSPVAAELAADCRRASLVLMPSRTEGFGLVGLEAICAGVPGLVSAESGLADLLVEKLSPEEVARTVVAVTNDAKSDTDTWSRAIERILLDRDTAFSHARQLRSTLSVSVNWAMAAANLFDRMNQAT